MLLGNYIVSTFPGDVRPHLDFTPFPAIDPTVGRYEEAPTNSVHIPARARNKADAQRFLAYVLRANVQEAIARSMLLIPANLNAALVDDRFVHKGSELIRSAEKLSQFFDRDADEGFATVAMKGFQEFMVYPDRLERILADIERARGQFYRN
jgi:multiple sugar transport system substrate-binding protein